MLSESSIVHTGSPWVDLQSPLANDEILRGPSAVFREQMWRQPNRDDDASGAAILISRWTDARNVCRFEESLTPSDRYVISIALKSTRLNLTRGRQIIFDGVMPAGSLHVSSPSRRLRAQFQAPFDFLHFHISADHFAGRIFAGPADPIEQLNDLILLRDSFAEQLAKALTEDSKANDREFVHCVGQTLAMHIARLEPQTKINALPKWRLKRVEDYVVAHFDRSISLSDLAKVAGLSRMHFAAQFRVATGYRPREYLLHQRVEQAKAILSNTDTPLAETALAVGFCTQAHFSTVFRRLTGETPARWRSMRKSGSSNNPQPATFRRSKASNGALNAENPPDLP